MFCINAAEVAIPAGMRGLMSRRRLGSVRALADYAVNVLPFTFEGDFPVAFPVSGVRPKQAIIAIVDQYGFFEIAERASIRRNV